MLSNRIGGVVDKIISDCSLKEVGFTCVQIDWPSFVVVAKHDGETTSTTRTAGSGLSMDMFDSVARRRNVTFDGWVSI